MMVVKELLLVVGIFFYIGLFTVGGGLAALPLIRQEIVGRGWITMQEYTSMVAISEDVYKRQAWPWPRLWPRRFRRCFAWPPWFGTTRIWR